MKLLLLLSLFSNLQQQDTTILKNLDSITVHTYRMNSASTSLPDVSGTIIYAGKHTNQLQLDGSKGNLAQNLARQLFAQIPGLLTWEMDGAGTQVNIGVRGTDAHRSIEMNMRQNGYNTNSDLFGYPENHYSLPLQAVQSIQMVRGAAALQFGPQFGGMMNYVIKQGDSTRPFVLESEQTIGSNNLFNSYNAIGGTKGKLTYYAYYDYRHGDGWRDNSRFDYHAYHANLQYRLNDKGSLSFQFSGMDYVQQIAGGLTDAQFAASAKQSFRSRNFFQPRIYIPALTFKYQFSGNTKLEITSNALSGERNSVQFINAPNVMDTINTSLGTYNPRQVDRDYYTGVTAEARLLHNYRIGKVHSTLAAGIRFSTSKTRRKQKGTGTTGSDFDLHLTKAYGIDLHLNTENYAAYAENIFQLTNRFSVTPGVRYERINTDLTGVINNGSSAVSYQGNRHFPLFGTGLEYKVNNFSQLYGNISQAYRPYLYASVTPADRLDRIDPNLKDTRGYDIDLGYRGHVSDLVRFDINVFYVYYGNRIGLITFKGDDAASHLLTTNVGNASNKGVEAYLECSLSRLFHVVRGVNDVRIFNSLAYQHGRYNSTTINNAGVNTDIRGKMIENTPDWINKTGITFLHKGLSTGILFSYNSKSYNDALNTAHSSTGVTGLIPGWNVFDWSFNWQLVKGYHFSAGVNNLTNEHYFNRRITMYPGPGILPADGRTFYITAGISI